MQAVIITVIVLAAIAGFGFLAYRLYRSTLREAKGFERRLKMVPLLIHLPPASDDTEVGSRDVRDVIDEKISQAETLYNVIASTAKQGFKSNFYGQRHLSFEVVAVKGVVNYYVSVPVALEAVVRQAVLSAYPTAHLEEAFVHNIFNNVGKITSTVGGELNLIKEYAYPIATFKDLKRDAMQSLLNAMGSLNEEDGAAVQILLRPARKGWEKAIKSKAESIKNNKGKKSGLKSLLSLKDITQALWKPPEAGDSKPEDKQLSSLEQSTVEAIENKTRSAGYEVLIRVVCSSNTVGRSQNILNNIVATFSLFNSQGLNGFKYTEAKNIQKFTTAYIMRLFPPELNMNILNATELATIFHLPDAQFTPTSQLQRQSSKQVDGPHNIPKEGLLMGYNVYRSLKKEIRLSDDDRRRHMYIVGQTGTGKSVFLENLALQDMINGKGFAFIDPHGDSVEALISMVPKERTEDVIYFNPGDMEFPLGFNLFEFSTEEQKDFLVQESINMLEKLYDPNNQGIVGPRYHHMFRNAALTIMSDPNGGTFIDLPKLFSDKQYLNKKLKHVKDQTLIDFWTKEIPGSERSNEFGEVKSWFVSKFGAFLSNTMMRNIIGQNKSSFDLRKVMDEGKILLVNLSKGRVGELNSKLLGMMFVMKFQAAAMSRAEIDQELRRDFSLYVDEFQNFSTESFATILSEARKYRLNLIVANQFIGQLTEEIRDAVFGNVGTIATLRCGATDADYLVKQFSPVFDTQDLIKLPNFNAVVRLMIGGIPSSPFSMETIPPLGSPNKELGTALKQLSAAKYGKPRKNVEKDIFDRLDSGPALGGLPRSSATRSNATPPFGAGGRPQPSSGPTKPLGKSSFLDEWLAKKKNAQSKDPSNSVKSNQNAVNNSTLSTGVNSPRPFQNPVANLPTPSNLNTQDGTRTAHNDKPNTTLNAPSNLSAPTARLSSDLNDEIQPTTSSRNTTAAQTLTQTDTSNTQNLNTPTEIPKNEQRQPDTLHIPREKPTSAPANAHITQSETDSNVEELLKESDTATESSQNAISNNSRSNEVSFDSDGNPILS